MGKSREFIAACKREGAPFPFGQSRSEWIMGWLSTRGDALNEAKIK
jgi:ribosome modulation factor